MHINTEKINRNNEKTDYIHKGLTIRRAVGLPMPAAIIMLNTPVIDTPALQGQPWCDWFVPGLYKPVDTVEGNTSGSRCD